MKTTLTLEGYQEANTKQGKRYGKVNTSEGVMGCFDVKVLDELVKNMGFDVEVEVEDKNGFKNIKAFYSASKEEKVRKGKEEKEPAYTKDLNSTIQIFIGMMTLAAPESNKQASQYMDEAVKLVKQARDGLK